MLSTIVSVVVCCCGAFFLRYCACQTSFHLCFSLFVDNRYWYVVRSNECITSRCVFLSPPPVRILLLCSLSLSILLLACPCLPPLRTLVHFVLFSHVQYTAYLLKCCIWHPSGLDQVLMITVHILDHRYNLFFIFHTVTLTQHFADHGCFVMSCACACIYMSSVYTKLDLISLGLHSLFLLSLLLLFFSSHVLLSDKSHQRL